MLPPRANASGPSRARIPPDKTVAARSPRPGRKQRALWTACGLAAVALGTLGIILPLLPTTPFLLLAAACFLRGSDRLHDWLIHHRRFGPLIRQYREHHAIPLRTKRTTLLLLWATLIFSGLFVLEVLWGRLLLLAVGIGVTLHLLSMRTMK